ncbi:hypothetical protein N9B09_00465 [bacterium]|nr:hypothetical protein [bacterium]MDB4460097.1 hypothetical protein [bacterium]
MSEKPPTLKPIVLYDHLPGILAGYPAVLFLALALLSLVPGKSIVGSIDTTTFGDITKQFEKDVAEATDAGNTAVAAAYKESLSLMSAKTPFFDPHMLFWIGLTVMLVWYIAFRFNLPKSKFFLMFFMIGTLVGIPVVLEIQGTFRPFEIMGNFLGGLEPTMDTGGWVMMSLVFTCIWLGNFIYSRTHMRVRIDESGLTVNRLGGKGERFELIGLKTENEPLDYLELFLSGVGSLSLKTRMNKPIFTMKRVVGLYRTPWFPFYKGKLARIDEMLSFQGKVLSVDRGDQLDAAEMVDAGDGDDGDHDDVTDNESTSGFDASSTPNPAPDDRGID